jgi:predicted GNAT family acetyltransferase
MTTVRSYLTSEMTDRELRAVCTLLWKTWSWKDSFTESLVGFKSNIQEHAKNRADRLRFVIWDGDQIVSHAAIFAREVHTENGTLRLGALTGVCTHADYRGSRLGSCVVRAAFGLVDQGKYPAALWMTTVPEFYKKLGARLVDNVWVNSYNIKNPKADPWPDEQKMIYPASYIWPAGQIDLNGPVY